MAHKRRSKGLRKRGDGSRGPRHSSASQTASCVSVFNRSTCANGLACSRADMLAGTSILLGLILITALLSGALTMLFALSLAGLMSASVGFNTSSLAVFSDGVTASYGGERNEVIMYRTGARISHVDFAMDGEILPLHGQSIQSDHWSPMGYDTHVQRLPSRESYSSPPGPLRGLPLALGCSTVYRGATGFSACSQWPVSTLGPQVHIV